MSWLCALVPSHMVAGLSVKSRSRQMFIADTDTWCERRGAVGQFGRSAWLQTLASLGVIDPWLGRSRAASWIETVARYAELAK